MENNPSEGEANRENQTPRSTLIVDQVMPQCSMAMNHLLAAVLRNLFSTVNISQNHVA
jgi:hypothetical protein